MKSGIYMIRNRISGRRYVGSALNIAQRWREHRHLLRFGKHHSIKLQRGWNKHGEEAFEFSILELAARENMISVEQRWIDALEAAHPAKGYNVATKAGSRLGVPHSPETRAKISAIGIGRKASEESKRRMREAQKGRRHTPETRAKMSAAKKGKPWPKTPEHVAKIAAALRGRSAGKQSPETIAKRVAKNHIRHLEKKAAACR